MSRIITVKIEDLKPNLFVRQKLNEDHVFYLGDLIEHGVEMRDRIQVTKDLVIVDGRHRVEAYKLNNRTELQAEVVEADGEIELIAMAYRANTGGSLPPSQADTDHTVFELVKRKVPIKDIAEMLRLPASLTRNYAQAVKGRMTRMELQKAAELVTDNHRTIAQAAEEVGIEEEKLREFMGGRRRRKSDITEIQKGLTTRYMSTSQMNASIGQKLLAMVEDGDISAKQAEAVLDHAERLIRQQGRAIKGWRDRIKAKVRNGKAA